MSRLSKSGSASAARVAEAAPKFTAPDRAALLHLAHDSILAALEHRQLDLKAPTPHLAEPRGVFTTLYLHGDLRGCVGYPLPIAPLYRAVAETAQAAGFDDPRFSPVTKSEAEHLAVSLSVLSPLEPIQAEDVEIGYHGLVVTAGKRRGLFLPQVPIEQHWDRTTFLEETCRKAGLHKDAYLHDATLQAFTAEIFNDPGTKESR